MDALLRLRVAIWIVVLGLWGAIAYEYLRDDPSTPQPMRPIPSYPVSDTAPDIAPPAQVTPLLPPDRPELSTKSTSHLTPVLKVIPFNSSPLAQTPRPPRPESRPRPQPVPYVSTHKIEDRAPSPADITAPTGFIKTVTRHFIVLSEQHAASDRFLELIENLHSNLMLDLASFSPWARAERTTIYLFKNQETYRRVTGRPPWSGGASSVSRRKLYLYESEELPGIIAHELTHIYFDGFFLKGAPSPLWLSEGMATLVQIERGLAAPNWLRENLKRLEDGETFPLDRLIGTTSTAGWPDAQVRLWYAQSYSLVRFLIRIQYRYSYFKFVALIRDGRPVNEALLRAYGAPYTRLKALEHAWRYELARKNLPEAEIK